MRKNFSSNTEWEPVAGYSRAVRVGPHVHVSGTTAIGPGGTLVGGDDPYAQTVQILNNIRAALEGLGASMEHVVRTRIYVADISRWHDVARAHAECFEAIRPATTMVEVSRLIAAEILVEIEAHAYVPENEDGE